MNVLGLLDRADTGRYLLDGARRDRPRSRPGCATGGSASSSRPSTCCRARPRSRTWSCRSSTRTAPTSRPRPAGAGAGRARRPHRPIARRAVRRAAAAGGDRARARQRAGPVLADEPTGNLDARPRRCSTCEALDRGGPHDRPGHPRPRGRRALSRVARIEGGRVVEDRSRCRHRRTAGRQPRGAQAVSRGRLASELRGLAAQAADTFVEPRQPRRRGGADVRAHARPGAQASSRDRAAALRAVGDRGRRGGFFLLGGPRPAAARLTLDDAAALAEAVPEIEAWDPMQIVPPPRCAAATPAPPCACWASPSARARLGSAGVPRPRPSTRRRSRTAARVAVIGESRGRSSATRTRSGPRSRSAPCPSRVTGVLERLGTDIHGMDRDNEIVIPMTTPCGAS